MQYLYASEISDFEDTKQHYKNLSNSIHSIHDLYLLYISLLIEIFKKAVNKYKISNENLIYFLMTSHLQNIYLSCRS